jgi:hypothetical protein
MKHMVPAQLANLRPHRGPGPGRPKGSLDFNNRIKRALLETIKKGEFKGKQIVDVFVEVMKRQLLKGDVQWAKFIIDRLEPINAAAQLALGVQVNTQINVGQQYDLSRLSDVELVEWERLAAKCEVAAVPAQPLPGPAPGAV